MRSSSILFLTERALKVQTVSGVLGKFFCCRRYERGAIGVQAMTGHHFSLLALRSPTSAERQFVVAVVWSLELRSAFSGRFSCWCLSSRLAGLGKTHRRV